MAIKDNLDDSDIIIIEADGKVNPTKGYGYLIEKRLNELNMNSTIISIVNNAGILYELPPKPLIFSGGMTEVTSDVDWIVKSREFIKDKINSNLKAKKTKKVPMFGICFGAQLLIESYSPGSVTYLEDPEIGTTNVPIDDMTHPLFNGYKKSFQGYTFHYNQIKSEKVHILSSHQHMNHKFIQIFEIPNTSIFGVQFHPELNYDDLVMLVRTYETLIDELGLDVDHILMNLPKIPNNSRIFENFYQLTKTEK